MTESASSHLEFARESIMVMAAPNGARRNRADHPALPISPRELADCSAALLEAGVSVLHLHVRDAGGAHTLEASAYRAAIQAIRAAVGQQLIIQVTTEAVGRYTPGEQMALVRELRPEAVSLALNELCSGPGAETTAAGFYAWLLREQIWPQHIVYSPAELRRLDDLRRRGILGEDHPYCLFVLGSYIDRTDGTVGELNDFLSVADCMEFPWAACCFGRNEHEVMLAASAAGGHVRLGFENNIMLPDGRPAPDNAALIRQFSAAPELRNRVPARAGDIRNRFFGNASKA